MNFELDGKRALVTGSTAGIGFATAHALAQGLSDDETGPPPSSDRVLQGVESGHSDS